MNLNRKFNNNASSAHPGLSMLQSRNVLLCGNMLFILDSPLPCLFVAFIFVYLQFIFSVSILLHIFLKPRISVSTEIVTIQYFVGAVNQCRMHIICESDS